MEFEAVLNETDNDMVELYHYHNKREFLAGVMHIDCFSGPTCDRIQDDSPVRLHLEVSQPKAYEILSLLAENHFDMLREDERVTAMVGIKKVIEDLSDSNWSYEDMIQGIKE